MAQVELSAGTIDYDDTGGDGPVLVLLHGLLMDATVWDPVLEQLGGRYRCVRPTLPLGAHRRPMRPDADLSLPAVVALVAEFLDALELGEVTLVGNDWGGAQLLTVWGLDERIARLALVACEAFDNYPPGLPGRTIGALARVPGGLWPTMQALRLRPFRRAPGSWGWMSKRPVPAGVVDRWFAPATTSRAIRRDLAKYATSVPARRTLLEWSRAQAQFTRPVLVVWAPEDRLMPRDHGRWLVELYPDARLVEIADSYTIVPRDRPGEAPDPSAHPVPARGGSLRAAAPRALGARSDVRWLRTWPRAMSRATSRLRGSRVAWERRRPPCRALKRPTASAMGSAAGSRSPLSRIRSSPTRKNDCHLSKPLTRACRAVSDWSASSLAREPRGQPCAPRRARLPAPTASRQRSRPRKESSRRRCGSWSVSTRSIWVSTTSPTRASLSEK